MSLNLVWAQFVIMSCSVFYEVNLIMIMSYNPVWDQLVNDNDWVSAQY